MGAFKKHLTLYLLFVGLLPAVRSQGGGNCMADNECNFPVGGACNGPTNSCVCFNGYTGSFCQTAPTTGSSPSTAVISPNNAVLLISLASLFFWFLSKERSRQEEDWIFYYTLYHQYLYH
ncbi:low-density lipoprotein receptor-related protein 2-like [Crassostrea angulata]|uniref:low-density lipoprotein receptor-related protein 2-like n=1 Tax=Magallana angulata TaxID=2784310 RepID=UPI0022B1B05A|nr:low-density lipoprotein receptor-related protein 2-like [Crassostrea angulata]